MKKRSLVALFGSFLFIFLISVCMGGSSVDGQKVYYDGKITVTTKGTNRGGDTFNESTNIGGFKIEHWNVVPGMFWQGDSFSCTAHVEMNDYNKDGMIIAKFGPKEFDFTARNGGSVPDVASLMMHENGSRI